MSSIPEVTMSKTKLDDNSLQLIADKLEYRIKHALESTLLSSIQTIVDGVISGLTTKKNSLETENATLRKDIVSLEKRVQTLETQHDADDQYSKRSFHRMKMNFWC
jgi:FtsZ-binding cell division protein ZapB